MYVCERVEVEVSNIGYLTQIREIVIQYIIICILVEEIQNGILA